MRDLALIGFLLALLGAGFRRPFLWVLAYVYIDIVEPQRLTYYLLNSVQVSLIAVALAVLGWAVADDKKGVRIAPRQAMIAVLLVYCGLTTLTADFPLEAADKWNWAWKALAFAAFLPFTLRTRLRIEGLLLFMVLSVASIIIVGGIKTLAGGGGYGELNLLITDNTGLHEGSIISAVAVAIVPVVWWLARHGTVFTPDWRVRGFAGALTFACLLMPIGTSARTGLLCIALLAVLTLRSAKRRVLWFGLMVAACAIAVPLLPQQYTQRMQTIGDHTNDESASTRLAVWAWTLDYVHDHPLGGGFNAFLSNHVRYETTDRNGGTQVVTDKARAYHSSYFEMLGEQGWPGLLLWLTIHITGLVRMEVLRRRHRSHDDRWAGELAQALQHAHLIYLLGGAFVGIALNPFVYMFVGAQIGLDTYLARRGEGAVARGFRRPRAALA